jgi:hypothetical protein
MDANALSELLEDVREYMKYVATGDNPAFLDMIKNVAMENKAACSAIGHVIEQYLLKVFVRSFLLCFVCLDSFHMRVRRELCRQTQRTRSALSCVLTSSCRRSKSHILHTLAPILPKYGPFSVGNLHDRGCAHLSTVVQVFCQRRSHAHRLLRLCRCLLRHGGILGRVAGVAWRGGWHIMNRTTCIHPL